MNNRAGQGNFHQAQAGALFPRLRPCDAKRAMEHFCFAYGSNLRSVQMARLCPGDVFLGPARLDSYRLSFTLPDEE
jgi:hypothetical protein